MNPGSCSEVDNLGTVVKVSVVNDHLLPLFIDGEEILEVALLCAC